MVTVVLEDGQKTRGLAGDDKFLVGGNDEGEQAAVRCGDAAVAVAAVVAVELRIDHRAENSSDGESVFSRTAAECSPMPPVNTSASMRSSPAASAEQTLGETVAENLDRQSRARMPFVRGGGERAHVVAETGHT